MTDEQLANIKGIVRGQFYAVNIAMASAALLLVTTLINESAVYAGPHVDTVYSFVAGATLSVTIGSVAVCIFASIALQRIVNE